MAQSCFLYCQWSTHFATLVGSPQLCHACWSSQEHLPEQVNLMQEHGGWGCNNVGMGSDRWRVDGLNLRGGMSYLPSKAWFPNMDQFTLGQQYYWHRSKPTHCSCWVYFGARGKMSPEENSRSQNFPKSCSTTCAFAIHHCTRLKLGLRLELPFSFYCIWKAGVIRAALQKTMPCSLWPKFILFQIITVPNLSYMADGI